MAEKPTMSITAQEQGAIPGTPLRAGERHEITNVLWLDIGAGGGQYFQIRSTGNGNIEIEIAGDLGGRYVIAPKASNVYEIGIL